jgi:hypothetical protein
MLQPRHSRIVDRKGANCTGKGCDPFDDSGRFGDVAFCQVESHACVVHGPDERTFAIFSRSRAAPFCSRRALGVSLRAQAASTALRSKRLQVPAATSTAIGCKI